MKRGSAWRPLAPLLWLAMGFLGLQALLGAFGDRPRDRPPVPLTGPEPPAIGLDDDFAASPQTRRILTPEGHSLDEAQVETGLRARGMWGSRRSYAWQIDGRDVAVIAEGLDARHHFAPAYLVGYLPHAGVEPWVPLAVLASRKRYRFDHEAYGGPDVWQTSRQAYHLPEGDCEDHAIALADWLIGLGLDARVALGTWRGGGHAWVVVLSGERTYLLEATHKQPTRALPLAAMMPDYRPGAMFDRERYWVNTGTTLTTDYRGPAWSLRSRFERLP